MSPEAATAEVVRYWQAKARDALASARDELAAQRLAFAVNRCYYAVFYATSAVLLAHGHHFSKHAGVRAALHQHLIKPGLLDETWGRFYSQLFQDRHEGDYIEFVAFDAAQVASNIAQVEQFLDVMQGLGPRLPGR